MAIPLTAFAAGAVVALLVGVFGKVHDPTLAGTTTFGFRTVIDMKVVLSVVIGVLAVLQLVGALWIYGRLGIAAAVLARNGPPDLRRGRRRAHRRSSRTTASGRWAWSPGRWPTESPCRRGPSCTASSAAP